MKCSDIDYKNIPVQSEIISGIVRLDAESHSCFRELDSFVSSDQGVATLVLRVANSALYNRGQKIATIPRAISVLGFNVVRSISMLAFSRSLFAQTRNPLFREHIWQHSLLTALASQSMCAVLGDPRSKDDAFIAGIMHDIGKVLLFTHDQGRYLEVLQCILDTGCSSIAAEQRLLEIDHCQVGREAVTQWKLPERFIDYMGEDLSLVRGEYTADRVRLSLAAANALIRGIGLGARAEPDFGVRKAALVAFGIEEALCDGWLQDEFVEALKSSDTYQLCAKLLNDATTEYRPR
jgi:putative nucleotidyltransferase with HDIG domain